MALIMNAPIWIETMLKFRRRPKHRYRALLGPCAEPAFDQIAELAAAVCGAPTALVSFLERDRQWFKARFGFGLRETPIEHSICRHALLEPELLVIPNLTADPRTRDAVCVTGEMNARFYAGAVTRDATGRGAGTVCVIDRVPREGGLSDAQTKSLVGLAEQVTSLICLRQALLLSYGHG